MLLSLQPRGIWEIRKYIYYQACYLIIREILKGVSDYSAISITCFHQFVLTHIDAYQTKSSNILTFDLKLISHLGV